MNRAPVDKIQLFDIEYHVILQIATNSMLVAWIAALREARRRFNDNH